MELRDRFGFSVVFITHDLSLLVELADTIAVMYAGKLVEVAPAKEIYRKPRHPYTDGLLNSFPLLHGAQKTLTGIPGSPPNLKSVPSGCPFHPRCAQAKAACSGTAPQLVQSPVEGDFDEHLVSCLLYSELAPPPERAGAKVARGG
jgi:peptide/nickel transport system ATP-binding protein